MLKNFLWIFIVLFLVACSSKVVKKQIPSIEMQKQDAKNAWRELDNQ